MKFYIPPQLKRLAIAFSIFIAAFLIIRHFLVPDSFGQFGFYRGASLQEIAMTPMKYAGQKACFDCHQDIEDLKLQDVHSDIRCETCHGPGLKHSENGDTTLLQRPTSREFCGLCHSKNAGKQKSMIFQVDLKEHNVNKRCIDCHNPHQPWTMKK
jgi:nitrate/TMAO reductase-like tetraheme cytochrome c subunit